MGRRSRQAIVGSLARCVNSERGELPAPELDISGQITTTVFLRQAGRGAPVKPAVNGVELGGGGEIRPEGGEGGGGEVLPDSELHGNVRERVLRHDVYPSRPAWKIGKRSARKIRLRLNSQLALMALNLL